MTTTRDTRIQLAHWTYRTQCLGRDLYEAKRTLDKAQDNPRPSRLQRELGVEEVRSIWPDSAELDTLREQVELLRYLEAESSWHTIILDIELRYNVEDRFEAFMRNTIEALKIQFPQRHLGM